MDNPHRDSEETNDPSRKPIFAGIDYHTKHEPRNLFVLVAHHIALRVGWIFKTESVIIPYFVDLISGAAWIRGCLPFLNRFGQSVPSLIYANYLRRSPKKKRALFWSSFLMAVPFLSLSVVWILVEDKKAIWMPALFLLLYVAFFTFTGINQLAYGTLQGKLIRPHRRGRLMGIAGTVGSVPSILCAWFLLRPWVQKDTNAFDLIFAFTGAGFLVSSIIALMLAEPTDEIDRSTEKKIRLRDYFRDAYLVLKADKNFRMLCFVAMMTVTSQMLFPHYQALGREAHSTPTDLVIWVIVQNAAAGIFSVIAGSIADHYGNRLALKIQTFFLAFTPLISLAIVHTNIENARALFWIPFLFLALLPVSFKTFTNYALELAEPKDHPRYLSTLKVCIALPFVFSPLVGLFVDHWGFDPVFIAVAILVGLGSLLTYRLQEPRKHYGSLFTIDAPQD